jgi:hypothetical protein
MLRLRRFIQYRRSSRLLVLWIAYSLAIQSLMASVGVGMSAFAKSDQTGLVLLCGHGPASSPSGDRQDPKNAPQCPFCMVASQSTGQLALPGEAPAVPACVARHTLAASDAMDNQIVVARFYRTANSPRAPPAFSV